MPVKVDDPTDIQSAYDDFGASSLHKAETSGALDGSHDAIPGYDRSSDGLDDLESQFGNESEAATVRDAESETSGAWQNNVQESPQKSGGNRLVSGLKKSGPIGGIVGVLIALSSLVSFFGGPGLLLVHIAEIITEKTNLQLASLEKRKTLLLEAKINNTTAGFCKGAVSVRCKFGTMSDANIRAFKNAGIEVVTDGKSVIGRNKVSHMIFTDAGGNKVRIDPKDFSKFSRTNATFSRALLTAYNSNFFGLHDKVLHKSLSRSKTSKASPFEGIKGEDEEANKSRLKKLIDITRYGISFTKRSTVKQPDSCDAKCVEDTKKQNASINAENSLGTSAEDVAKNNLKAVQPNGFKAVVGAVNAFSVLDNVCMIPTMANAIGMGAKVIRSQQEIRFAMTFLAVASMIKANKAVPGDVSFQATLLTKTVSYSNGTKSLPWDSSTAWKHVAYGDKGIGKDATPFLVGGGLGGEFSGVASGVLKAIGGGDAKRGKTACNIAGNAITQTVGTAISFIPGVGQAIKGGAAAAKLAITQLLKVLLRDVVKGAAEGAAMDYVLGFLIAIATDMVAGIIIDENTIGDAAGSAFTIGAADMLSQTAGFGGNGVLSPAQAVVYNDLNNQIVAQYKDVERATKSPFDVNSTATFMGSLYTGLMPYLGRSSSMTGAISSAGAIVTSTFGNLFGSTKASALSESDYTQCEDYEYRDLNVATSATCVVQRGIPVKYLDIGPEQVNEELIAKNHINPESLEPVSDQYMKWVQACTTGAIVEDDTCMYGGSDERLKALFSLHFVDLRVQDVLENGTEDTSDLSGVSTPQSSSVIPASGNDQELAKQILANKSITISSKYRYQFEAYARGEFGCRIDSGILKLIASLGTTRSIYISSLNRLCTNTFTTSTSLHWVNGGGSAVDIAIVDGAASTGARPADIKVYQDALTILPDKKLQLGQVDCRAADAVIIPPGNRSIQISDTCNHVHIGIYPN
ncbi:hypothetical protein IPM09_04790 [Candidatus Saccharibacteria bacterium]|nr:MAG: hypothetical protein IPM09_04790 [Candidatus Saccharibacteria bacterium]